MRRKQLRANRRTVEQIIGAIDDAMESCKDQATLDKLKPLQARAENLAVSDSKAIIEIDEQLFSCIEDLQGALKSGNLNTEKYLMGEISRLFDAHAKACPTDLSNLSKSDLKAQKLAAKQIRKNREKRMRKLAKNGSVGELRLRIAEFTDRSVAIKTECRKLFDALKTTNDPLEAMQLESQLKSYNGELKSNAKIIGDLLGGLERRSADDVLTTQESMAALAERVAPYKDEELIARSKELEKKRSRAARSKAVTDQILGGQNMGEETREKVGPSAVFSAAAPVAPAAPVMTAETWKNPYADMENPYGDTAPKSSPIGEYFEDVDEQIAILKKFIDVVGRKIEKKEAELNALAGTIKELLLKRKDASAAECVTLDGKIDLNYSEYSTVKTGIGRLMQEQAKYSMELNIISQIGDIRDIAERNKTIAEISNGRFMDIAALATAVSEDTARSNEVFSDTRDAVAVANDTPIENMTHAQVGVEYSASVKDEDKYADLEKELGVRA